MKAAAFALPTTLYVGCTCSITVIATPAKIGDAMLVPDRMAYWSPGHALVTLTPGAQPAMQLPVLLNDATLSFWSLAPIECAPAVPDGEKEQAFAAELPAAVKTRMWYVFIRSISACSREEDFGPSSDRLMT